MPFATNFNIGSNKNSLLDNDNNVDIGPFNHNASHVQPNSSSTTVGRRLPYTQNSQNSQAVLYHHNEFLRETTVYEEGITSSSASSRSVSPCFDNTNQGRPPSSFVSRRRSRDTLTGCAEGNRIVEEGMPIIRSLDSESTSLYVRNYPQRQLKQSEADDGGDLASSTKRSGTRRPKEPNLFFLQKCSSGERVVPSAGTPSFCCSIVTDAFYLHQDHLPYIIDEMHTNLLRRNCRAVVRTIVPCTTSRTGEIIRFNADPELPFVNFVYHLLTRHYFDPPCFIIAFYHYQRLLRDGFVLHNHRQWRTFFALLVVVAKQFSEYRIVISDAVSRVPITSKEDMVLIEREMLRILDFDLRNPHEDVRETVFHLLPHDKAILLLHTMFSGALDYQARQGAT